MASDLKNQLSELKDLHESGLLTDSDYQKQKDALLAAALGGGQPPDGDGGESAAAQALLQAETARAADADARAGVFPEDTGLDPDRSFTPEPPPPPPVNGTAVIVLAVLSFACGGVFFSIPGLIMARSAQAKIRAWEALSGRTHPEAGTVKAGFWVSVVNIVLTVLVFLLYIMIFLVALIAEL
ncbi:MAG: hypothetical protein VX265_09220 [Myxococcota bacterium]|nr:hypothetical protein [Myxococcota bacterium]MEC8422762.1 hypothetical protein [Myxococcota bacterium]